MEFSFFKDLFSNGLLSGASYEKIKSRFLVKPFSLHWELRTLLYLGVLLLTGGLGIVVYNNIDTIGHQVILVLIAAICTASFLYCFKNKTTFTFQKVVSPNAFYDYILLLASITFLIFIGYLQYQYVVFGDKYGLATFIPMLVLFFVAYYFDHLGVLSMAIVNLGTWAGIAVTPTKLLMQNNFHDANIIYTGTALGILLLVFQLISHNKRIKPHFGFTYMNFGMHLLFVSCISGMLLFDTGYLLWLLLILGVAVYLYQLALTLKSFYVFLILTLYTYFAISAAFIKLLLSNSNYDVGSVYLVFFYFIGSAIALIYFLTKTNRKFKKL